MINSVIINEELFQKRCKQRKSYLVYLVTECEMGSEGWSGWSYYAIAHGDTDEEIYNEVIPNQLVFIASCRLSHS